MRPDSPLAPVFRPITGLFACLLAGLVFSTGCSGADEQPEALVNAYEVRGVITALPAPGPPASELKIRHESIPEFVGKTGDVVGMDAMIMPFPLEAGVDLSDYAVGDAVAFTFVTTWGGIESGWVLTEIAKLPEGTALNFGEDAHSHDHAGHDHHGGHAH